MVLYILMYILWRRVVYTIGSLTHYVTTTGWAVGLLAYQSCLISPPVHIVRALVLWGLLLVLWFNHGLEGLELLEFGFKNDVCIFRVASARLSAGCMTSSTVLAEIECVT